MKPTSNTSSKQKGAPKLLNPEQIAARRVPIEQANIDLGKTGNWFCHYCSKRFVNETIFMKHHCEARRRAQEMLSPIGVAAYAHYLEWMKQKRFSSPSAAAFMESKYYRSFINFAQLVMDANITSSEKYVQLMIQHEILPVLWCRDAAYALYLDWSDKISAPIDQVQKSINYLFDICEKENIKIEEVFQQLGPQRILMLVRQRVLTPWLLFCSASFGTFLKTMDMGELKAFNGVVNGQYWAQRFQTERATIESIKHIAKEIGL